MNKLISNEGEDRHHNQGAPPLVPSAKMDVKTLNAAMEAGTLQTTSKGEESGAKYFVCSPTVLI